MNVQHPLTTLITTSIAAAQRQAIADATEALDLPFGTIGRILVTEVFADGALRDQIEKEAAAQIGVKFTTRTDRCAMQMLIDDETDAALQSVARSTGAGRGVVARAALIVAVSTLTNFNEALRDAALARAAAKARSQQQLINRLSRMNQTNEVQA
ncbi:hypothetical protein MJ547_04530, partial [Burkholderia gladioli]